MPISDVSCSSPEVTLMYSESGAAPLNTVHELWRHRSMKVGDRVAETRGKLPQFNLVAKLAYSSNN